jgi:hypothetical protein
VPYTLSTAASRAFLAMGKDVRDNATVMNGLADRHEGELAIPYYQGHDTTLDTINLKGQACQALTAEWLTRKARGETDEQISTWLYDSTSQARLDQINTFMRTQHQIMGDQWNAAADLKGNPFRERLKKADFNALFQPLNREDATSSKPRYQKLAHMNTVHQAALSSLSDSESKQTRAGLGKFERLRQLELSLMGSHYRSVTTLYREINEGAAGLAQFLKSAMSQHASGASATVHFWGGPSGHAIALDYQDKVFSLFDPNRGVFVWKSVFKQTKLQGFKAMFTPYAQAMAYDQYTAVSLNLYTRL